jgi:hypothetical protein
VLGKAHAVEAQSSREHQAIKIITKCRVNLARFGEMPRSRHAGVEPRLEIIW